MLLSGIRRMGMVLGSRGDLGVFFLCLRLFRVRAEVVSPGGVGLWKARRSDSSQDVLARFHVYASLNPQRTRTSI